MLSAPVVDSWEGPNRQCAIGDAIFRKKFFPRTLIPSPFSIFWRRGSENFFSETASTLCRGGHQCLWRRKHAQSKPFRRVSGVRGG